MDAEHSVDDSQALLEQVNRALANATPLLIQGSNSKAFLGRAVAGEVLDTRSHRGIVSYDPTELVITARCGTPLMELAQALDKAGQMLACEPPSFGAATVGGRIRSGSTSRAFCVRRLSKWPVQSIRIVEQPSASSIFFIAISSRA